MEGKFFVYFDEFEATKKISYAIADSNDWITFKN